MSEKRKRQNEKGQMGGIIELSHCDASQTMLIVSPRVVSFPHFHRRGLEKNNCKSLLAEPRKTRCLNEGGAHKSRFLETHNKVLRQRVCV